MAKIPGVNVIAPVVPFDTTDVHPSHEAKYGRGGYRTVATLTERDAIPAPRREAGMLVFVADDGKVYKLLADMDSWEEFKSGASTWSELGDKPATFPPEAHGHVVTDISGFDAAVAAAAPPTTDASLLVNGTLSDDRLSANIARLADVTSAVSSKADSSHTHTISQITDAGTAATRNAPAAGNASSAEVVLGNDTRLSDQRVPTDGSVTAAKIAANQVIGGSGFTATTNGFITLGGVVRVSAASVPFATLFNVSSAGIVTAGEWQATAIAVAYGGTGATDAASARTNLGLAYGSAAGTVCEGNDARLSDARTPTTHSHSGSDITSGTISAARLGSGTADSTTFLRGDGSWAAAGSSSASDLTSGTLSNARLTSRSRAAINTYLWSSFR